MNKLILVFVVFIAMTANAFAAPALKMATVDAQAVFNDSKLGKAKQAEVRQYFENRRKILETDDADFRKLLEEYQKQVAAGVLKDKAKSEKEETLRRKEAELQKKESEYNAEIRQKQNEVFSDFNQIMYGVIKRIAAKEKINIVLNKTIGQQVGQIVLFSDEDMELTARVIEEMDKEMEKKEEPKK